MAARTTTSCFGFLKEPLLFLQRNPKIFNPLLLYAAVAFPVTALKLVYVGPLTSEMDRHITQMEEHTDPTDPSSVEYAGLLEEVRQEATELLLISVAIALVLLTLAFAKQIVACFTTYSGDCCSFSKILLRRVAKYAKGPLIAIAVFTMLQVMSISLLGSSLAAAYESDEFFVLLALCTVGYTVFLWLSVAAMVIVAASVVDEGAHFVRGFGPAWQVITQVRRTEGCVLVLVTLLLPTVLSRLYAVALLYSTKQSTGRLGQCLLSADTYNLLTNVHDLYYLTAASVYSSQGYYYQAMESKEVAAACDEYAQIPSGEANI